MKIRRYLVILGIALFAQGALATQAQSQTLTWTFNASGSADGFGFSCSATFTLPFAGGSASFLCEIATATVNISALRFLFSVPEQTFNFPGGVSCTGKANGMSAITVTETGFSTVGAISGGGTCTDEFGSDPFTVSGSYNASAANLGKLLVSPTSGLIASGDEGGPFSPSSQSYTLTNTGGSSINFTVSKTQSWISLSKTSGSLAAGASTSVLVAINSNATLLIPGVHSDTVSFTNTTNGQGNTSRSVSLTVNVPSGPSVTSVTGDVTITVDGIESPLTSETSVTDGAVVITGTDGQVELTFEDGSKIILRANSRLLLAAPDVCGFAIGSICLKLSFGKLRAIVKKLLMRQRFAVRTPIAAVAVRGTEFSVEHKQVGTKGRTTVVVFSGTVEVIDNDGNITVVNAGEQVTIPTIKPMPWLLLLLD